jgi:hypothetical protein
MIYHVDFIVEGLDDRGQPSGLFRQGSEVVARAKDGTELGRFRDKESFRRFFHSTPIYLYRL